MQTPTRAEVERLLGIAKKLLQSRDLNGSYEFAILAQETEPLLEGFDQILTIIDVLLTIVAATATASDLTSMSSSKSIAAPMTSTSSSATTTVVVVSGVKLGALEVEGKGKGIADKAGGDLLGALFGELDARGLGVRSKGISKQRCGIAEQGQRLHGAEAAALRRWTAMVLRRTDRQRPLGEKMR